MDVFGGFLNVFYKARLFLVIFIPRMLNAHLLSNLKLFLLPMKFLDSFEWNASLRQVLLLQGCISYSWRSFLQVPKIVFIICKNHILHKRINIEDQEKHKNQKQHNVSQAEHAFEPQKVPVHIANLLLSRPVRWPCHLIVFELTQLLHVLNPVLINLLVNTVEHQVTAFNLFYSLLDVVVSKGIWMGPHLFKYVFLSFFSE